MQVFPQPVITNPDSNLPPAPVILKSGLAERVDYMRAYESSKPKEYWYAFSQEDITRLWLEDLMLRISTWSNVIEFIEGETGTAKSITAITIAMVLSEFTEKKFSVAQHMRSDITDFQELLSLAKDLDTVVCDEVLDYHGQGSQITVDAIGNILKTIRAKQVNIILVGVEPLPMKLYHHILLTKWRAVRQNDWRKTEWVGLELWVKFYEDLYGNYFPVGHIVLPAPDDEVIQEYLNLEKMRKVSAVQRERGMVEADRLKDNYNKLYGRGRRDIEP